MSGPLADAAVLLVADVASAAAAADAAVGVTTPAVAADLAVAQHAAEMGNEGVIDWAYAAPALHDEGAVHAELVWNPVGPSLEALMVLLETTTVGSEVVGHALC